MYEQQILFAGQSEDWLHVAKAQAAVQAKPASVQVPSAVQQMGVPPEHDPVPHWTCVLPGV